MLYYILTFFFIQIKKFFYFETFSNMTTLITTY